MTSGLAGDLLAVSILLAVGLAAAALPRRSAAERHWLLAVCTACALAFPALRLAVPAQWAAPFESPRRLARTLYPPCRSRSRTRPPPPCELSRPRSTPSRAAPCGARSTRLRGAGPGCCRGCGWPASSWRPPGCRPPSFASAVSPGGATTARSRPVASGRRRPRRGAALARAGPRAGRRRTVADRDLGLASAADPAAARGPGLAGRSRPHRRRA